MLTRISVKCMADIIKTNLEPIDEKDLDLEGKLKGGAEKGIPEKENVFSVEKKTDRIGIWTKDRINSRKNIQRICYLWQKIKEIFRRCVFDYWRGIDSTSFW